jgi:beta propeller repeat protein
MDVVVDSTDGGSPDDGDVRDAAAENADRAPEDGSADEGWSPDGCDYWMVGSDCDGRDYPHPDMAHRDCGPGARELYLPRGLGSDGSDASDAVSAWGDHAFILESLRLIAMDLTTGERRTVLCDSLGVPAVSVAEFGASGFAMRGTAAWEDGCLYRIDSLLFDWDTLAGTSLHAEYDDIPRDAGWPCSAGMYFSDVDVYGDIAAIMGADHNCLEAIFTLDLSTGVWTRQVALGAPPAWVSIWGRRIAYASGDVFVLDLDTHEIRRLTEDGVAQESVDIWEDQVVWTDWRDGGMDIYRHDLTTGETSRVNRLADGLGNPRVFNGRVLFQAGIPGPTGGTRIWSYNIASGDERQVTFLSGHQFIEELWEDRLYFSYLPDDGEWRPTLCEMTIGSP